LQFADLDSFLISNVNQEQAQCVSVRTDGVLASPSNSLQVIAEV
jgi:hypothetical protein